MSDVMVKLHPELLGFLLSKPQMAIRSEHARASAFRARRDPVRVQLALAEQVQWQRVEDALNGGTLFEDAE